MVLGERADDSFQQTRQSVKNYTWFTIHSRTYMYLCACTINTHLPHPPYALHTHTWSGQTAAVGVDILQDGHEDDWLHVREDQRGAVSNR